MMINSKLQDIYRKVELLFICGFLLVFLTACGKADDAVATKSIDSAASIEHKISAQVLKVIEEKDLSEDGQKTLTQLLEVKVEDGVYKNKKIQVENNNSLTAGEKKYVVGDRIFLVAEKDTENKMKFIAYDYNRLSPLFWLFGLFMVITIMIGRWQGLAAFFGMACSFLIIFYYVLPQILVGANSFFVAIVAAMFIVPITFYMSHGFNRKATAAIIATMLTLVIVGLVATIAVDASHLSGHASEEVNALILERPGVINVMDLLLAGIIISLLGILDDIAISQAAIVFKLKEVSPEMKFGSLFAKAMDIGRDHIASVVNTLILVYTGAALPLLLLFLNNPAPFTEILNEEFMAEEILRTLVASFGIVIAVPLTTLITVFLVTRWGIGKTNSKNLKHHHQH